MSFTRQKETYAVQINADSESAQEEETKRNIRSIDKCRFRKRTRGVDELGVDQMGVDEMGSRRSRTTPVVCSPFAF